MGCSGSKEVERPASAAIADGWTWDESHHLWLRLDHSGSYRWAKTGALDSTYPSSSAWCEELKIFYQFIDDGSLQWWKTPEIEDAGEPEKQVWSEDLGEYYLENGDRAALHRGRNGLWPAREGWAWSKEVGVFFFRDGDGSFQWAKYGWL